MASRSHPLPRRPRRRRAHRQSREERRRLELRRAARAGDAIGSDAGVEAGDPSDAGRCHGGERSVARHVGEVRRIDRARHEPRIHDRAVIAGAGWRLRRRLIPLRHRVRAELFVRNAGRDDGERVHRKHLLVLRRDGGGGVGPELVVRMGRQVAPHAVHAFDVRQRVVARALHRAQVVAADLLAHGIDGLFQVGFDERVSVEVVVHGRPQRLGVRIGLVGAKPLIGEQCTAVGALCLRRVVAMERSGVARERAQPLRGVVSAADACAAGR